MTTPALDRDRLLADLDRTLADLRVGRWPSRAARYWRLRGFEQGLLVIRAGIVDGDYDREPPEPGLILAWVPRSEFQREKTDRGRRLDR